MEKTPVNEEIVFKKAKYYPILMLVVLAIMGTSLLAYGFQYFSENELSNSAKVSFSFNFITFLLILAQVWYKEVLVVKSGEISITSNVFKKYKFLIEDVRYIDRHFDEWTFYLKNDKKYVVSQDQIQKKDVDRFRAFMLQFPKKHPKANV